MTQTSSNIIISEGQALTINASQGTFDYRFPYAYPSSGEEKLALQSLALYLSWFNVTANFNNTTGLSYIWSDGVTYPVVFPPGFYTLAQLNQYLQFVMTQNGHYLTNSAGVQVFYLSFVTNQIYYTVTLTATPVPTSLPAGWTAPVGFVYPATTVTPQMVVGETNWGLLIGYSAGSYPPVPSATVMNYNSSFTPQATPITQVMVLCDWSNDSRFSYNPSVIASFVPTVAFGEMISFSPPVLTWYAVARRVYNGMKISLVDQNYRPLSLNDTSQSTFTLLVQ
jgi:hypothetical protein